MFLRLKFSLTLGLSFLWLILSIILSIQWINELNNVVNKFIAISIVTGIAYIPGFLSVNLIASLLMVYYETLKNDHDEEITILIPIFNEEDKIYRTLRSIYLQDYLGKIIIIIVDNNSNDNSIAEIEKAKNDFHLNIIIKNEPNQGKHHALNLGLSHINTNYFITLDADTCLHKDAVKNITTAILSDNDVKAVAGSVLVLNDNQNFITRIQMYDYLFSISAVKNMQSAYRSTLVAQGAFSIYDTNFIKEIGGYNDCIGEDIVLTWKILHKKQAVLFEPRALCYTVVPDTLNAFFIQRSRWARGMIEALKIVPPWKQGTIYAKYLTFIDLIIPIIDFAYILFFIPGVFLCFLGKYYIVGIVTLYLIPMVLFLFYLMFLVQYKVVFKTLNIKLNLSFISFILFILIYQALSSVASIIGYYQGISNRKRKWR